MPRATVTQRLRRKLRQLIEAEGHGAAKRLSDFSFQRPGGTKLRTQDLSYFKHGTAGRENPITIDHLDDIADYFRVSIGELFEVKAKDLSADEQRLVLAFRALHEFTREHFLALVEAASVSATAARFRHSAPIRGLKGKRDLRQTLDTQIYDRGQVPASEAAKELERLRAFLTEVTVDIAAAAAGTFPDRPLSNSGTDAPKGR